MRVCCVTGATGFVGGHVAKLIAQRGDRARVTFRDQRRRERLHALDVDPVRADVLDRGSLRRAVRGCELVFHTAGFVGTRPPELLWRMNALSPRLVVEAAAAEGVRRVIHTSSVAALGRAPEGEAADEETVYRAGEFGLAYGDAKHEGEAEVLAAGARLGVEVVIVNPSYVLGVPVDPYQAGETSTRVVGNFMLGKLPAVVDGSTNVVDVEDVAAGHLLAAEKGKPGERYVLGGYNLGWVELIDRLAEASGKRRPLLVLPREVARLAQVQGDLGLPSPIAPEAFALMAQNWRASSRKAKRELGYRTRPLERTVQATVDWYRELIESGTLTRSGRTPMTVAAAGMRVGDRVGLFGALRAAEGYLGRRLVAGS
ncbi:MAG: NAD-dependent epimerase/dehydratase family protein [Thermoleophilaceae bacterium]